MKNYFKRAFLIITLVVTITVLSGCSNSKNSIVGSWKHESSDYTYTFNKDKTGNYDAVGTIMKFTYEDRGNKLVILYNGNTSPFELDYSIDGDKLTITDSFGTPVIYYRK